jgi:putative tryptophan/tyrosine transport system substrate-binding protein
MGLAPQSRSGPRPLTHGLAELGWVSGQNIIIEHRSADGHFDRLPALTAELIGLKINLIVALSAPGTAAAKKVAGNIPIVFVVHGDPIGTGHIQSLAHPGGHITGLSKMHPELSTKQLDLLSKSRRAYRVSEYCGTQPTRQ